MLELKSITGGYGDTTVLRDVSLTVPPSSVVALLGPNGAGKSTTLRMASGLLRPRSGAVVFDGDDVTSVHSADRVRRGLCHLPEGRGVFPSLSVRENLVLFSPKGREAEAFDEAVSVFSVLGARRRQAAGTLSGGEQQMLALARAYVSRPKVLLVDEASLGLAPLLVDQIFDFLDRVVREGMSLLLVEQYVARALQLASSVYVIHKGEIVFSGPSRDVAEDMLFALYAGEPVG
ncbi:MAG TPA: ABC transporter ATP-binding protein [Acidimicrobiales bacterium]|jgi:branched-chain amino acid transport system ATP-binding protein